MKKVQVPVSGESYLQAMLALQAELGRVRQLNKQATARAEQLSAQSLKTSQKLTEQQNKVKKLDKLLSDLQLSLKQQSQKSSDLEKRLTIQQQRNQNLSFKLDHFQHSRRTQNSHISQNLNSPKSQVSVRSDSQSPQVNYKVSRRSPRSNSSSSDRQQRKLKRLAPAVQSQFLVSDEQLAVKSFDRGSYRDRIHFLRNVFQKGSQSNSRVAIEGASLLGQIQNLRRAALGSQKYNSQQ